MTCFTSLTHRRCANLILTVVLGLMEQYPFCRLNGPANILVVPARHSASISVKMMQELGDATVIGPILSGVGKPIQLCTSTSTANDILNMAVLAACKVG